VLGRAFRVQYGGPSAEGQKFTYMEAGLKLEDIELPLIGVHQADNAACAIRAYRQLCDEGMMPWSAEAARIGLTDVRLDGRLQVLSKDPLVVVDGAHNELGARALADAVRSLWPDRPLYLVFGVLEDKDYLRMAKSLFHLAFQVMLVPVASFPERSADPHTVAARTVSHARELMVVTDLSTAVKTILADMPEHGLCLIAGSLYLAGEAISLFEEANFSPTVR
jgi:dihydrofolate synthase/folylpolyglutamate synthase